MERATTMALKWTALWCLRAFKWAVAGIVVYICIAGTVNFYATHCDYVKDVNTEKLYGMTSAEIVEIYGEFDAIKGNVEADGTVKNGTASYVVRNIFTGMHSTPDKEWLVVFFDENGAACDFKLIGKKAGEQP